MLRAVTGAIPDAVAMRRIATESARGRRPQPFRGVGDDVRYAVRSQVKSPAFALSVARSLSLEIAATIAPFAFLNALFFRPFPGVFEHDRQGCEAGAHAHLRTPGLPHLLQHVEDDRALREGMTTLTGLAAQASDSIAVTIDGRAHSLRAAMVSGNYFESLGVRPALGRAFIPGEDDDDADNRRQRRLPVAGPIRGEPERAPCERRARLPRVPRRSDWSPSSGVGPRANLTNPWCSSGGDGDGVPMLLFGRPRCRRAEVT